MYLPMIGIVIPVFNRIEYTVQCLRSLRKIEYPNFKIIVVNDGSTDGTPEVIAKHFPEVTVLHGDGTLWWAGGTNLGIRHALDIGCKYVLFLNNDDEVDKYLLYNLVNCAKEHSESLIACKIKCFEKPDTLIYAGGDVDWARNGLITFGAGEIDQGGYDLVTDTKWVPGAGTFTPDEAFKRVGLLDQRLFPHYAADIDFTLRCHAAGFKILLEPKAVIYKKMNPIQLPSKARKGIFNTLCAPLFSIKSPVNVKLQLRFIKRHCPRKYRLRVLLFRYASYYRGFMSIGALRRYLNTTTAQ